MTTFTIQPKRTKKRSFKPAEKGVLSKQENQDIASLGIQTFAKEYKKLRAVLDDSETFTGTKASFAMVRAQLSMCLQALPIAEESLHKYKNERAIYGLVALSNHARELAHDLRNFNDGADLVSKIMEQAMQPTMQALASDIIAKIVAARQNIYESKSRDSKAEIMKRLQVDVAKVFETHNESAKARVSGLLLTK